MTPVGGHVSLRPVPPARPLSSETIAAMQRLIGRYPQARSALLPMLYLVQAEHGYVSREGMGEVADLLGLSRAEVAAVATFYTMFKRRPCGTWLVSVCTNVSCDLAGGSKVFEQLREHLGEDATDITADGAFTIEEVECLGACDGAPVVQVNYENYERVAPDAAVALVDALRGGTVPPPSRGAAPGTSTQVSRRLSNIEAQP